MTVVYVAWSVAAFVIGMVVGLWVMGRHVRAELLDMDAVAAEQRVEIDTLTTLVFGEQEADR